MSGRRLLAAAGAALVGLLLVATPASAAPPNVEWTRPTVNDPVLKGPGPITATISTDKVNQKITQVEFELVQPVDDSDDCFVDVPEDQRAQPVDKQATVDVKFDVRFPCNGAYELKAHVTYEDQLLVIPVPTTELAQPTLPFKVAIPPAQVTGLSATYDPGSKNVGLTWKANTEIDLEGYRVLRNAPGPAGFETVAGLVTGTTFTDPGIDAEHRYQVIAVRSGPDGRVEGKASAVVTAGPESPQPTAPQVGPPNQRRPAPSGTTGGDRPSVRRRTATTVDTGFSRDLPFDPSQTTTTQVPTTSTEPEGQAAVLAEFDDDDDDPRGTLVPIAGGLALLMSAVHMRLLSQRVGDDDIPILPGA
ncbi:MAG: hypothetical protein KY452_07680 [Actinobacteria bacterium]|nr:hypothetical protein [Actinomycetota bacterium]